jgi:hypothetical protein
VPTSARSRWLVGLAFVRDLTPLKHRILACPASQRSKPRLISSELNALAAAWSPPAFLANLVQDANSFATGSPGLEYHGAPQDAGAT